jgi:hypothetical protein
MKLVKLALLGLTLGAMTGLLAAPVAAQDEPAPADYSIFYSPPERVDALFEAMLDAMPYSSVEELEADRPDITLELMWADRANGGVLPDLDALEKMEAEFGDMPEYWQLRYVAGGGKYLWERVRHLKRATEVAPDDPASLYFYTHELYRGTKHTGPDGEAVEYTTIEQYRRKRERAEMMERVAEMDGRNAYYYYEAGGAWSFLGEYPHVMELFDQGNRCPYNEKVELFPFSYIVRNLETIPKRFPDRYLLATMSGYYVEFPKYIRIKTMVREIITVVSLSGNLNYLTITHRMACRMGAREYASLLDRLVARVLTGIIAGAALDLGWDPEGPMENQGFVRRAHYEGTINGIVFAWTKREVLGGQDPFGQSDGAAGSTSVFKAALDNWWKDEWGEIHFVGPAMAKQFDRMEPFDFADPAARPFVRGDSANAEDTQGDVAAG